MAKQVPFIGREHELAAIEALVTAQDTKFILCVSGSGGIGKTRLLQEIRQQFGDRRTGRKPLFMTDILDFDNPILHTPYNLQHAVAKQIGEETFAPYQEKSMDFRRMEIANVSREKLAEEQAAVNQVFAQCFNQVSSQRRIILLFDTTDALLGKQEVWQFLGELFGQLNNCMVIFAGRDARVIGEFLQTMYPETVRYIELHPLKAEDSEHYLQQKLAQMYTVLEPEIARKLIILSQGKPIFIDLAVEWQTRNIPLHWLVESSVAELASIADDAARTRYIQEFEHNLIRHIADVRQPIDRLFLVLSRIYPLDVPMIAELLHISVEDAARLIEEAKTYIFVKSLPDGRITLHDEMRRMVNAYLWEIVDPGNDRRIRDSKIAAAYLEKQIHTLETAIQQIKKADRTRLEIALQLAELEEKQELLTKQQILHTLLYDQEKGFSAYKAAVWKARNARKLRLAMQLEEIVQPYITQLQEAQCYEFNVLHGRLLNDRGEVQKAQLLFERLLNENRGVVEREADLYNALAVSEVQTGNFNLALDYQQKCFDILKWLHKTQFIPDVANQIGYIYRLKGELQESNRYYRIALEAALQAEKPAPNIVASVLNNLGYVLGLQGKYHEGKSYCQEAIKLWTDENVNKGVGQGEITLATILRNRGNYDDAIDLLQKAMTRFEEPDDSLWFVRAYLNLGWTQWYAGLGKEGGSGSRIGKKSSIVEIGLTRKQRMLHLAQESFEKSLELAKKYHVKTEIPSIFGQYGRLCWELDEKEKARHLINDALQLSQEVHDLHQAIDSLVALAEFDYMEGKYENISTYAELLRTNYEDKGDYYPLFFGRMRRILADIAYEKQEYDTALPYYAEGLALIKQHGGYSVYSIMQELDALEKRLDALPPVTAYKWITHLKDYWMQQTPAEMYSSLFIWCDQQIVRTKFR